MSHFSSNDLVFYKENEKIMSGGYLIDSILLKQGLSPITTINQQGGQNSDIDNNNRVSSIFENLAVPAGLLYIQSKGSSMTNLNERKKQENIVLDDDIHDEFLKSIEVAFNVKKKKNTKRQKNNNKNNKNKSKKLVK